MATCREIPLRQKLPNCPQFLAVGKFSENNLVEIFLSKMQNLLLKPIMGKVRNKIERMSSVANF